MAFDAQYAIAARGGREEALFGRGIELVRPAYEKTLIGEGYPAAYLEFPLLGEPYLDLLSVHGHVEPGSRFAAGAGFGYQALFDWYALARPQGPVSLGIEVDCGTGECERAGAYLQYRDHTGLVGPFLESVGAGWRTKAFEEVAERMGERWRPSYVGLFPARAGAPMRIGGYLDPYELRACAEDPQIGRAHV